MGSMNVFATPSAGAMSMRVTVHHGGGVSANNIAKWDGSNWSALGSGISSGLSGTVVDAIAVAGAMSMWVDNLPRLAGCQQVGLLNGMVAVGQR
jgi:hypothetical protein